MIVAVWTTTYYLPHRPSVVLSLDGTTMPGLTNVGVAKHHIQHIEACNSYRSEISNQEKKIARESQSEKETVWNTYEHSKAAPKFCFQLILYQKTVCTLYWSTHKFFFQILVYAHL